MYKEYHVRIFVVLEDDVFGENIFDKDITINNKQNLGEARVHLILNFFKDTNIKLKC